jgi:hypothetical protein
MGELDQSTLYASVIITVKKFKYKKELCDLLIV